MCSMGKVTRDVYKCDECGHEWLPEGGEMPKQCPSRKCRSRKWNEGDKGESASAMPVRVRERAIAGVSAPVVRVPVCPWCESSSDVVDWGDAHRCRKCARNF